MFFLHSANKTENLLAHLVAVLQAAPLSSPFQKEVFLIQSQGMERWLSQQLAGELKIWANFEFFFPGKFFSSIAARIDSRLNDAALDRSLLLWRFENLLRNLHDPVYQPLQLYLKGENIELKRFQLAQQLAKLFDQYQIMRPDLLTCWQQGKLLYPDNASEPWQQKLWQELSKSLGSQHRGSFWLNAIDKFKAYLPGHFSDQLPERISIFGVNSMPPLFLDFLHGLAQHSDVHLYLLNPSEEYWADLDTQRQRAKAGITGAFEGHPLLAALGQQGREFQNMLLTQTEFNLEFSSFDIGENTSILQAIQNGLLSNRLEPVEQPFDDSISVHSCHSRMREIEVLKNLLIQCLESDPKLQLREIVVMAPDIQEYEPFIAAVFSDIQYAIADRSLRISNSALDAFIRFLDLIQSRFGWQSVLDLLENNVVYPSFGLDESDLELISHWVQATQVRWAKSSKHKQALGFPELSQNTWEAALERLLMGYCVGTNEQFVDGILPYIDIEGSNAGVLGGLNDYLQLLFNASETLQVARPLADWHNLLSDYADQLLTSAPTLEKQQLNELLAELSETLALIHHAPVALSVIVTWLETRVSEQKSTNGFLRGQLTFCSMLPMRSIPFKVVALLGMNNEEFPKIDRQPSFDLLSQYFRPGDRSSRADDRYQFLEILLSARQKLIITYIGQSISRNDPIPPSIVVSELLGLIQTQFGLTNLITTHPLQPFSPRYFKTNSTLFSYVAADCATAMALHKPNQPKTPWWQGKLAPDSNQVIELYELLRFFMHPQKYFLQRHLDVQLTNLTVPAEEREPFNLNTFTHLSIKHQWIEAKLNHDNLSIAKLKAQGLWLSGIGGDLEFYGQQAEIDQFVSNIRSLALGHRSDDIPVDLTVNAIRLIGTTRNHYENGSLFYRYANLTGKDLISAWLQHLVINRIKAQQTYLLNIDGLITLTPEQIPDNALEDWLALYQQGQQDPTLFFTEPAFEYHNQAVKLATSKTASKAALVIALEKLQNEFQHEYRPELKLIFEAQDNLNAVINTEFETICQNLLAPIKLNA